MAFIKNPRFHYQFLEPMMIATSSCFNKISRCKLEFGVLVIATSIPAFTRDYCITPEHVNQILIRKSARYTSKLYHSVITSIPVAVSWSGPFSAILHKSIGCYHLISTQASPNKDEGTNKLLNQILIAIENDSITSKELCTTYINKVCTAWNVSGAAQILQSLRDKNIFLHRDTYNLLLTAADEVNDVLLATQVFKDLLQSGELPSTSSYRSLAKALAKTDDDVPILKFINDISEVTSPRSIIIIIIINRIIFAFTECRETKKAMLIFNHLKSSECKPDLVTYNTVLLTLGQVGRVDEMLREFEAMKESNIDPDIISYNTVLNSLRKVGRLDLCLAFLKEMRETGIEPDLRTYTVLIESFGRAGNVGKSLELFDEMKQRQIRPSIYIYRSLIDQLKKMGKLELAMTLFEEMNLRASDLVGPKDFKPKK